MYHDRPATRLVWLKGYLPTSTGYYFARDKMSGIHRMGEVRPASPLESKTPTLICDWTNGSFSSQGCFDQFDWAGPLKEPNDA